MDGLFLNINIYNPYLCDTQKIKRKVYESIKSYHSPEVL